jgi:hypothetical protein
MRLPHPSQLFFCDSQTTESELLYFVKRVTAFPNLSFALVEVNRLPLAVREALLTWCSKLFLSRTQKAEPTGLLYLGTGFVSWRASVYRFRIERNLITAVFTDRPGEELFSFLDKEVGTEASVEGKKSALDQLKNERLNCPGLFYVTGPPCCGTVSLVSRNCDCYMLPSSSF